MRVTGSTTVAGEPATEQRKRLIVSELPQPGRAREDSSPTSNPARIGDSTQGQERHAVFRLLSPVFCLYVLSPEFWVLNSEFWILDSVF
jgi:hypothetical protein